MVKFVRSFVVLMAVCALAAPHGSGAAPKKRTRIVIKGDHVEHWLNRQKVVEYDLAGADWKAKVAASKFSKYPNYGLAKRGFVGIQGDHPGELALRHVRIRELP